jgi:hypothetical protein
MKCIATGTTAQKIIAEKIVALLKLRLPTAPITTDTIADVSDMHNARVN